MENVTGLGFRVRRDRIGYRPVFALGNTLGRCPMACTFCSVQARSRTSPNEARVRFEAQLCAYLPYLDGPYHPLIYNQGNVTNPAEFPHELLDHVLERFRSDTRVRFVSVNSRERFATPDLLRWMADKCLPFPVHFIFGQESFSLRTGDVLEKHVDGELGRFRDKLLPFNTKEPTFGLDVSLLYLPELHLRPGETRSDQPDAGIVGLERDLRTLLLEVLPDIPLEVNIHPFTRVAGLPWDDVDLARLVGALPRLQKVVNEHGLCPRASTANLFLGAEGIGYDTPTWRMALMRWRKAIDTFNVTGRLP